MCHADEHRAEALPLVLLGIRSAWKEDLKALSAELVTGGVLRPFPEEYTDVTDYVSRLKAHIGKIRPVPATLYAAPSTFNFKKLATASIIFLRHGALRVPQSSLRNP